MRPAGFWPVLIAKEGVPVHRNLTARVSIMILGAGLLIALAVASLVIVDVEGLEAAEPLAL